MLVIALGLKLTRQRGEIGLVRKEPKDLAEFRPEKLREAYETYSSSEDYDSEEDSKNEPANDDDWNDV